MKHNKVEFKCEECGKITMLHKSQTTTRRFCNRKCFVNYKIRFPMLFHKKGSVQACKIDPNKEFTDMTITLVAAAELKGEDLKIIIKICHWDKKRFYQKLEMNRSRVDARKKIVDRNNKKPININYFMEGYELKKVKDMAY